MGAWGISANLGLWTDLFQGSENIKGESMAWHGKRGYLSLVKQIMAYK